MANHRRGSRCVIYPPASCISISPVYLSYYIKYFQVYKSSEFSGDTQLCDSSPECPPRAVFHHFYQNVSKTYFTSLRSQLNRSKPSCGLPIAALCREQCQNRLDRHLLVSEIPISLMNFPYFPTIFLLHISPRCV